MKNYNPKVEVKIIRSILDGKRVIRERILGYISKAHFGYGPTIEVFTRVLQILKKAKEVPSSDSLKHDIGLSSEAKETIKSKKVFPFKRIGDVEEALSILEKHRKARIAIQGTTKILKAITEESNPDKAERVFEKTLFKLHTASKEGLAHGKQQVEIAKKICKQKFPNLIKTGFSYFDERTGGFPCPGVVVLAAPPGGMKTTMMISMANHQFVEEKVDVCIASLEMEKDQIISRQTGACAKIKANSIRLRCMTSKEKRKFVNYSKFIREKEIEYQKRFTIYSPEDDVSFIQLMNILAPFKYKIIYIDYINLLNNDDSQDDWKHLREVTRLAKRLSKKNKCTIVLLAQLNEDTGKIYYSQGIRQNADNWWRWYCTQDDKEAGYMTIEQPKARDAEEYDFRIGINVKYLNFHDIEQESSKVTISSTKKAKKEFKDADEDLDMSEEDF